MTKYPGDPVWVMFKDKVGYWFKDRGVAYLVGGLIGVGVAMGFNQCTVQAQEKKFEEYTTEIEGLLYQCGWTLDSCINDLESLMDQNYQEVSLDSVVEESSFIIDRQTVMKEIVRQSDIHELDIETTLSVARCESDFNPYAKNPKETSKGIYQFKDSTWKHIDAKGHQFDYKENIKQFMIWFPKHPNWWPNCKDRRYEKW